MPACSSDSTPSRKSMAGVMPVMGVRKSVTYSLGLTYLERALSTHSDSGFLWNSTEFFSGIPFKWLVQERLASESTMETRAKTDRVPEGPTPTISQSHGHDVVTHRACGLRLRGLGSHLRLPLQERLPVLAHEEPRPRRLGRNVAQKACISSSILGDFGE